MPQKRRRSVSAEELAYYRAHFLQAIREDDVVCLECGRLCAQLGSHVRVHGLILEDYKEKWGYNRTTGLVSPQLSSVMRDHALARNLGAFGTPDRVVLALTARREQRLTQRLESRLAHAEVARARREAGWPSTPRRKKVDDATLRTLAAAGGTLRGIAARAGLARSVVERRLRRLGLTHPASAPLQRKATDAEVLALREEGLWCREIAERTGMTTQAVGKRLRKLRRRGVAVPRPARRPVSPLRKISDEDLLALLRTGLSKSKIADQVGLSRTSVWRRIGCLRRRGLLLADGEPRRRTADDATLLALAGTGLTRREIAARTGMAYSSVGGRLRKLGLTRAAPSPR